jgi:hypothetical protein
MHAQSVVALFIMASTTLCCAKHKENFRLILTVYAAEFQGIWSGMIGGTAVQTLILVYLTVKCDWDEEVGGNA